MNFYKLLPWVCMRWHEVILFVSNAPLPLPASMDWVVVGQVSDCLVWVEVHPPSTAPHQPLLLLSAVTSTFRSRAGAFRRPLASGGCMGLKSKDFHQSIVCAYLADSPILNWSKAFRFLLLMAKRFCFTLAGWGIVFFKSNIYGFKVYPKIKQI